MARGGSPPGCCRNLPAPHPQPGCRGEQCRRKWGSWEETCLLLVAGEEPAPRRGPSCRDRVGRERKGSLGGQRAGLKQTQPRAAHANPPASSALPSVGCRSGAQSPGDRAPMERPSRVPPLSASGAAAGPFPREAGAGDILAWRLGRACGDPTSGARPQSPSAAFVPARRRQSLLQRSSIFVVSPSTRLPRHPGFPRARGSSTRGRQAQAGPPPLTPPAPGTPGLQ